MKYYKTILRQPSGTALVYPTDYQQEIGNFAVDHLYYDTELDEPRLLLLIEDKNSANIIRTDVEELTETEAKTISETNETRTESITDEAKVRRLEIKAHLGIALTPNEEKALDPNDPTPGFGIEKILADRLVDLKAVEAKKEAE